MFCLFNVGPIFIWKSPQSHDFREFRKMFKMTSPATKTRCVRKDWGMNIVYENIFREQNDSVSVALTYSLHFSFAFYDCYYNVRYMKTMANGQSVEYIIIVQGHFGSKTWGTAFMNCHIIPLPISCRQHNQ